MEKQGATPKHPWLSEVWLKPPLATANECLVCSSESLVVVAKWLWLQVEKAPNMGGVLMVAIPPGKFP